MKKTILFNLFASVLLIFGCTTKDIYVKFVTSEKLAPRPANCELEITDMKHDEEKSFLIAYATATSKFDEKKAVDRLNNWACSVGADGISEYSVDYSDAILKLVSGNAYKNK